MINLMSEEVDAREDFLTRDDAEKKAVVIDNADIVVIDEFVQDVFEVVGLLQHADARVHDFADGHFFELFPIIFGAGFNAAENQRGADGADQPLLAVEHGDHAVAHGREKHEGVQQFIFRAHGGALAGLNHQRMIVIE